MQGKDSLGRIRVRDIILDSVELLPPIRENTLCAFGIVTYNRQMIMTLNYDEMMLSKTDASKLLSNAVESNQLYNSKIISNR